MRTGSEIVRLRTKSGLTQEELAQKLFVSQQLVSLWENGTRRPDYRTLERMAEIFSVDMESIYPADRALLEELSSCLPENKSFSAEELTQRLNTFLPLLSEKERIAFIRRYYFADSSKAIASMLGIKSNNVRTVLSRVRVKLKNYLSEEEK